MKELLVVLVLAIFAFSVNAQKFGYENVLKNDFVTGEQKSELRELIEIYCLFNGDMQFLVNENDLKPLAEDYVVKAYTIQELIDHRLHELSEAKTTLDSVEIYMGLESLYQSILNFEDARNSQQFVYDKLNLLLNNTELDSNEMAAVYRNAGIYMFDYGQDPSASYPYFTQAILYNPADTTSYVFIMMLYIQYGGYEQADSIGYALEQKFPDAFSPYILHTQSVVSMMYTENADSIEKLVKYCLTDMVDLSYLEHLKNSGKGSREELLYYLLLENLVLMKYYSVLGSDDKPDILSCDMKLLDDIRTACRSFDHKKTRVPQYTTLNAIAWTYAINHEFDSSLYYLNLALDEVKKLDAGYATVTHNIMSNIMAFTFLSGDTLGALHRLEDKLAYSDTIGILIPDLALISRLYAMIDDFENSHKYADLILGYDPSFFPAWRIKAYADYKAGERDSVFTYMDHAMQIDKQNFETYLMYGLLYLLEDKPALAYKYLEAAWYLNPDSEILDNLMRELYVKREE